MLNGGDSHESDAAPLVRRCLAPPLIELRTTRPMTHDEWLSRLCRCTLPFVVFASCALVPLPGCAEDLQPLKVGIRARISGHDVLGKVAPEEFREYDVSAVFALPWARRTQSAWEASTRLMASAGVLSGADKTALVVSLIPLLALESPHGRFTFDLGVGGALFSRHRFGTQDFGGAFQFALTAGAAVLLSERLGVGYRFQHYSDAGLHGPGTTGADHHMLEITWKF